MKNQQYYLAVLLLGLLFSSTPVVAVAQELDRSVLYEFGEKFYYEVHPIPYHHHDTVAFVAFFRIRYDAMSFTRRGKNSYVAKPNVFIDALDSIGIIRSGQQWSDSIYTPDYERTLSKEHFAFGAAEFRLPRGNYLFSFEVGDAKTPRSLKFRSELEVSVPIVFDKYIGSIPIFAKKTGERFTPFIANDDIPFSKEAWAIINVVGYKAGTSFSYIFERLGPTSLKPPYPAQGDGYALSGAAGVRTPSLFTLEYIDKRRGVRGAVITSSDQDYTIPEGAGVLIFPFPSNELQEGTYRLSLSAGPSDTMSYVCKVIWEDKPLSLRNMDYALSLLRMIATDDELKQIITNDPVETERRFLEYWKAKDPEPSTMHNRAMATFYARADFAYFNFQTLRVKDGTKTDKGKVYILYGKPTDVSRSFDGNKRPVEIWRYDNEVRRQFEFTADGPGAFVLRQITNLDEEQAPFRRR